MTVELDVAFLRIRESFADPHGELASDLTAIWRALIDAQNALAESRINRRYHVDLLTPAETAIRNAMLSVEEIGAHPLLTDAIGLLEQAKNKVADFVDGSPTARLWRDSHKGPLTLEMMDEADRRMGVAALPAATPPASTPEE